MENWCQSMFSTHEHEYRMPSAFSSSFLIRFENVVFVTHSIGDFSINPTSSPIPHSTSSPTIHHLRIHLLSPNALHHNEWVRLKVTHTTIYIVAISKANTSSLSRHHIIRSVMYVCVPHEYPK